MASVLTRVSLSNNISDDADTNCKALLCQFIPMVRRFSPQTGSSLICRRVIMIVNKLRKDLVETVVSVPKRGRNLVVLRKLFSPK
jgi:hypothetical protein